MTTARALLGAVLIALAGCRGAAQAPHDDSVVSTINPCLADDIQVPLQVRSPDLADEVARGLVTWTAAPEVDPQTSTLSAKGTLDQSAMLFDPLDGDGPAFSVHYGANPESLAELIPDRPAPGQCWVLPSSGVTVTPATLELAVEGAQFSFQAYSPLFRDVGDGELELRVWGTDADDQPALLAGHSIAVTER